ncbi:hypothetical protein D3C72_258000 [compost metagenome]
MPAQFEEVVVTADLFDLEDVRPDLRQGDFHRTLWRGIFAAQPRRLIRFWQRLAVEFAVGGQRQCLQAHVSGRHQGLRQLCLQMTAQILDLDVQAFGKPSQQLAVAYQHHAILHGFVSAQRRFDFAQFDAHAAQFDLIIVAPQVFDVAISQPAREVAGAVHARLRFIAERVVEKAFGSQLGAMQITARHAGTADIQLASNANRYGALLVIEQVNLRVGHRPTDMQHLPGLDRAAGGNHRGFGRAVVVDHRERLLTRELAQFVATDQQRAQGRVAEVTTEGVFGDRRGQETHLQRLRAPPRQQFVEVLVAHRLRWQMHGRADAQRWPDLPRHGIETKPGDTRRVAARVQVKGAVVPVHEVFQRCVFDHHAFRLAGGARGVDHVGQMRRGQHRHLRIAVRQMRPVKAIEIDHARSTEQITRRGLRQNRQWSAVLQQVGNAFRRVGRVDRHITGARLEDRQQRHQHLRAAPHAHGDAVVRLHAKAEQMVGQAVGALIELAIGQRLPALHHRQRIRPLCRLSLDQRMKGCATAKRDGTPIEIDQQSRLLRQRQNR